MSEATPIRSATPLVATGAAHGLMPVPWLTLGFVAAALGASLLPGLADALVYERAATRAGDLWRPLTAQWVHGSPGMALIDLGVVLVCGTLLERRSRVLAVAVAALGLLAVAAVVHGTQLHVRHFAGSSGLATALFSAATLRLALTTGSRSVRLLALAALCAAFAKNALEQWAGLGGVRPYLPDGARVLPAVHLAGSGVGAAVVLVVSLMARRGAADR